MSWLSLQISVHLLTEFLSWAVLYNNICWFDKVNEWNLISCFLWRVNNFTQQERLTRTYECLLFPCSLLTDYPSVIRGMTQITESFKSQTYWPAAFTIRRNIQHLLAAAQHQAAITESSNAATQTGLIWSFQTQMPLTCTVPRCPAENKCFCAKQNYKMRAL